MMNLAENGDVLSALDYLALQKVDAQALLGKLDDPTQALAGLLALIDLLHDEFGGKYVAPIIRAAFGRPVNGSEEQWLEFGGILLKHALWREADALSKSLQGAYPEASAWLQVYQSIERSKFEQASQLLAAAVTDVNHRPKWQELRVRLAFLKPQDSKDVLFRAVEDGTMGYTLRARAALVLGQREKGEALLKIALDQSRSDAESWWMAGSLAAEKDQRESALDSWQKALAIRPRFAACLYDRGRFRKLWGDLPGGESDYAAALEVKPWAGKIAIEMAQHLIRQKKHGAALKILDTTLMAEEDQPDVVAFVIDVLRFQGEAKSAEALAEKAIARYPKDAGLWLAYGALLQGAGRKDQAIRAYQQASRSAIHASAVKNNLAKLLQDDGDVDAAIAEWEEARRIDRQNVSIAINLAYAYRQRGDIEEANALFDSILNQQPNNADALRGKAACALSVGSQQDALDFAKSAMREAPNDVRSYLALARSQASLFRVDDAIGTLNSGLDKVENAMPLVKELWSILMQKHEYQRALDLMFKAVGQYPNEVENVLLVADALNAQNNFDECLKTLHKARTMDPELGGRSLVAFLRSRNTYVDALHEAQLLLKSMPSKVRNYGLVAEVLYRMQRYDEAVQVIERGIALDPQRVSINKQLVGQLLAQEDYPEALRAAQRFLAVRQSSTQYLLCIEVLRRSRQFNDAYQLSEKFLAADPLSIPAYLAVANAAERMKKIDRGIEVLERGLATHPSNLALNRVMISYLARNERYSECVDRVRKLLDSDIGKTAEMIALGAVALIESENYEEARKLLEAARHKYRDHRGIYGALYALYRRLEQHDKAHKLLVAALIRFPGDNRSYQWVFDEFVRHLKLPEAELLVRNWEAKMPGEWAPLFAKLVLASKNKDMPKVIETADYLLRKWPKEAVIFSRLNAAYSDTWNLTNAIRFAAAAVELRPDNIDYLTYLIATLAKAGDFDRFDELLGRLEELLGDKRYQYYAGLFFLINCHPDYSVEKIFKYYDNFGKRGITPYIPPHLEHRNSRDPDRVIRIGYVSPDFRRHAVAYFSEPLLIEHDRTQFELFAFANFVDNEQAKQDPITERFKTYFHHWIDISSLSEEEFLRKVREHQIDILVDLAGHTKGSRLISMARKPAPIQVSFALGSGQTTGLEQIDYFIAEQDHIPIGFEKFCSERVIRQAWRGYPYMPAAEAGDVTELPFANSGFITFGSCSRPIRIGERLLSVWAKILNRLPNAKLQLDHVPYAEAELAQIIRERFVRCGGNPHQLLFANTRPYWNVYQKIDIMLDTFPTGSGTTTTDSLWMGVPVVTLASRPLMGLFTALQLKALGLEQYCVATSEDEYIERAIKLASDPALLTGIRMGLRGRFLKSSLMDYKGYAKDIARIYREMWREWCSRSQSEDQPSSLESHTNA